LLENYLAITGIRRPAEYSRRLRARAARTATNVAPKALASEIESLQAELAGDSNREPIRFDNGGIDFYNEVERYEIELIKSALNHCGGNQTQAARLLRMKSTTLNAKMKHYGLNPVRSITLHRPLR
jgi:DNA-binding NtrC family response regulator